jgi:hypothetical protein
MAAINENFRFQIGGDGAIIFFRNGVSPASASIDAHSRFIAKFQAFTSIKQRKSGNQLAIA